MKIDEHEAHINDAQHLFLPFAIVTTLAFTVAAVLPGRPENWWPLLLAAAVAALGGATVQFVPWQRLPDWVLALPALSTFGVAGLLREAHPAAGLTYASLLLLPVITIALTQSGRMLTLGFGAIALFFGLPVALDPAKVWSGELRAGLLWTACLIVTGYAINTLLRAKHRSRAQAEERADTLAESTAALDALALALHGVATSTDGSAAICDAALQVAGASIALIAQEDRPGELMITASAGKDFVGDLIKIGATPSGCAIAFVTGEPLFIPDVAASDKVSDKLKSSGKICASMLYQPVFLDGRPIGVLGIGWDDLRHVIRPHAKQAIELLGHQASTSIQRSKLLLQLELTALTDELTGVPNRRQWERDLPREIARASRGEAPLSVALIDLDRFKQYNDTYGHQAGDVLLHDAAGEWQQALRGGDLLARYGGEEFGVILVGCGIDEARVVADRLRLATPHGRTCSIGVAEWRPGESADEIVARADAALYAAKEEGRNRVVVSGEEAGLKVTAVAAGG